MPWLNSNTFRTNVLTIVGALGYLTAFGIAIEAVVTNGPVPVNLIIAFLITSGAALGLDFGGDFLPISSRNRENDTNDTDDTTDDKKREAG